MNNKKDKKKNIISFLSKRIDNHLSISYNTLEIDRFWRKKGY